jgi:hypothetical protein
MAEKTGGYNRQKSSGNIVLTADVQIKTPGVSPESAVIRRSSIPALSPRPPSLSQPPEANALHATATSTIPAGGVTGTTAFALSPTPDGFAAMMGNIAVPSGNAEAPAHAGKIPGAKGPASEEWLDYESTGKHGLPAASGGLATLPTQATVLSLLSGAPGNAPLPLTTNRITPPPPADAPPPSPRQKPVSPPPADMPPSLSPRPKASPRASPAETGAPANMPLTSDSITRARPSDTPPPSPRQKPISLPPTNISPPSSPKAKTSPRPSSSTTSVPNNTGEEKKADYRTRQQKQGTEPQYKLPLDFAADDAQPDSITDIARCVVLGELESDFNMRTIGRYDVKHQGKSVYTQVTRYTNSMMITDSQFLDIIQKAKKDFLSRYEGNLDKLAPVGEAEKGKSAPVDLDLVFPYVQPVFDFVCGEKRLVAACRLPPLVMALLRKIDHQLVEALLSRRLDQARLGRLLSATPSRADIDEYCKRHDWSEKYFKKLRTEDMFSSKDITDYRRNLFAGVLFTRCLTPFLLYSDEELKQDPKQRKAGARPELLKLSEATNKIFKNDYKEFVADFIDDSDRYLAEKIAEKLALITRSEMRIDELRNSKKARANASSRSSAPALPQGAAFRRAMAEEKESAAREAVASRSTSTENDKARRDAAIDVFKSKYPFDFGNDQFALEFNRRLRTWKRNAGEVKIKDIERQMRRIHRQVKDDLAEWEDEEMNRQPGLSGSARAAIMPEQNPKAMKPPRTPEKEGSKAKQPVQKHAAMIKLDNAKAQALDTFASNDKHKAEFQRYPLLRQAMEEQAVGWVAKGTGGNFVLALQKIFEEQVTACFFQSQIDTNSAQGLSAARLRTAVVAWKDRADNRGKLVHTADLQQISLSLKYPTGIADGYKETAITQMANAAVHQFMQLPEVREELKDAAMKAGFNERIKSWLDNGGYSSDPARTVREGYHDALMEHFQRNLKPDNASGEASIAVFEAAKTWSNTNADQILTSPILTGFLNAFVSPRQSS